MAYTDAYASIYQKMEGFKIQILFSKDEEVKGYLSLNQSTRSTYDIAMRDATIDGLLTMSKEDISKLKPSQIFYKEILPNELFIIQSVNKFEFQKNTLTINAIKQNSFAKVQRIQYDEEIEEDKYTDIYSDIVSFVTTQNKDEKNFAAGVEDNTNISIQIPKKDIEDNMYEIKNQDRIILYNLNKDFQKNIKVESVDPFSVPGIIKIYGTYDTRTGE